MKILKNFVIKMIGKMIAKKLNLKEDSEMSDKKKWYQSKTMLSILVAFVISVYQLVDANLGPAFGFDIPDIPSWVYTILAAVGLYGRKVANKTIE